MSNQLPSSLQNVEQAIMHGYDRESQLVVPAYVTDNATHVLPTPIAGDEYTLVMSAAAANPSGTAQIWTSSIGCKAFIVRPFSAITAGTSWLAIASSIAYDDSAALSVLLASLAAAVAAPDGLENEECGIIFRNEDSFGGMWDGTNKIKTICGRASGAFNYALTIVK